MEQTKPVLQGMHNSRQLCHAISEHKIIPINAGAL
jgi:hypothetical protein